MLPQTVIARVVSVSEVLMSKVLLSKVPRSEAPATLLALKLRKFTFEEISFRASEPLGWPTWALQRRREARHGRLSQIPRSGELPRPPARSQGSKVASSRWLSDCHCHRLYLQDLER